MVYGESQDTAADQFQQLIEDLDEAFSANEVNIEQVVSLMEAYQSQRSQWQQYYHEHPDKYTRNLVYTGNGKYNLILLVWRPGHGSAIHDHSKSHCFMKILQGQLTETRFGWPTGDGFELQQSNETVLKRDSCSYMHDKFGLHQVGNKHETETAVSLHLYIPPFDRCQCFDQGTGASHEGVMSFFSRDGQIIFDTPQQ